MAGKIISDELFELTLKCNSRKFLFFYDDADFKIRLYIVNLLII